MLQASDLLLELGYLKSGIDIQFPMYKVSNSNTGNFAYSIQTAGIKIYEYKSKKSYLFSYVSFCLSKIRRQS